MSNTLPLQAFLPGKSFVIPSYQRDYAWEKEEIDDLFGDIQEALEAGSPHYLGTIVLASTRSPYEIVDGQQRLSTLMLIVYALISQLPDTDPRRIADEVYLLKDGTRFKLDFGVNQTFMEGLFSSNEHAPLTRGQRRLAEAYRYCFERAGVIFSSAPENIYRWLDGIKNLEVIPFFEPNTGRAIRIFQSVNDRGRQLTDMDKAKALLVLYSNQFLDGQLDVRINEAFGTCFAEYDKIKEMASQDGYKIELINRANFSENDMLRYHYLAYDDPQADDWTGSKVLELFLKRALKDRQLRPNSADELSSFISDYIEDLAGFMKAFSSLVEMTRFHRQAYTVLVVQGLSPYLYPLAVRMHQRQLLTRPVSEDAASPNILHCLAAVDLRVYKIRGTDPAKDIGYLSHRSRTTALDSIMSGLRSFLLRFMQDGLMETYLSSRVYGNGAIVPILLAYEQLCEGGVEYDLQRLVDFSREGFTQEHILAQQPNFDFLARGFVDEGDFSEHVDRLGNLTLLTSTENSRCRDKSADIKMSETNLYPSSKFRGPKLLAHRFSLDGNRFDKAALLARTKILIRFALKHWAIW